MNWNEYDLDRCEHGRHSVDPCSDCPDGKSSGNLFLMRPWEVAIDDRRRRHKSGEYEVRIGTRVHGEPIWTFAHRGSR